MDFFKKHLSTLSLIGLLAGVLFGLFCPQHTDSISFIGAYYVQFLKYMIVPVVFTSIVVAVYDSSRYKDKIIGKTLFVFVTMFVCTFLISSLVVTLVDPVKGFTFEGEKWSGSTTDFSIINILTNLIPKDLKKFFSGGYLFSLILLSVIVGFVCGKIKNGHTVITYVQKAKAFFFKVLEYFMYVTPLASFSLISNTVAKYGSVLLGVGVRYILTAYLCALIAVILVMILPVLLICKMSPVTFLKKVYKVWMVTVSTCSSGATLPYTIKVCKEEFNIPERITDVVVPLGTTIHMCGGAVSFALLGLFCSRMYGVEITLSKYLLMLVSATLINMAAPGIPNGGVVIGASYLQILGIPLDFIGFYSGIYKLLDMCYTTLNVTDDIASNVIVNRMCEKQKA
ncbi:MAG: dicarboxylate/amino acid:cation symporter [Erysipelotrichaceae bacterium]|nr:dicarboxylate/amino acid:cation symporter [Erysipelotrichaceae bacterium]